MSRFSRLGKLGAGLGVGGVLTSVATGIGGVLAGSWFGGDNKVGETLEDANRAVGEPLARANTEVAFEGFWSKIEQILKAIVVATGGEWGGGLMNYTRKMQGLEPIARNQDGNIDLNGIKTIYHGPETTTPTAPGATDPSSTNPVTPIQASILGDNPLIAGGILATAATTAVVANRSTPSALMDRALKAEAVGDLERSERLFEKAAAAEMPRFSGRFAKAASLAAMLGLGAATTALADEAPVSPEAAAPVTSATVAAVPAPTIASIPETVVPQAEPKEHGFWSNAFQTAASFGTGVVSGVASIPEGLYDSVDSITGDYLPGSATTNSTSNAVIAAANYVGVDTENHQNAIAIGELASIAVPVAGVAGVFAKSARAVETVATLERTSDVVSTVQLGQMARTFLPG